MNGYEEEEAAKMLQMLLADARVARSLVGGSKGAAGMFEP